MPSVNVPINPVSADRRCITVYLFYLFFQAGTVARSTKKITGATIVGPATAPAEKITDTSIIEGSAAVPINMSGHLVMAFIAIINSQWALHNFY